MTESAVSIGGWEGEYRFSNQTMHHYHIGRLEALPKHCVATRFVSISIRVFAMPGSSFSGHGPGVLVSD
jgi:hypothetical protein